MPAIPTQKEFQHPYVLFVEGLDEVNVFTAILTQAGLTDVDVRDVGGKERLRHQLPVAVKQSSFAKVKAIGVVQDADDSEQSTFASICSVLKACQLPQPKTVGAFVTVDGRRIGALVLPGNGRQGYLEDLFLEASSGLPEYACVDSFVAAIREATGRQLNSKSRAHALMVALEINEPRLGRGFQTQNLPANRPAYNCIREFASELLKAAE